MQTIYIMDTEMPIPKNHSNVHILKDVQENDISELNTSYTMGVIDWAQNEFQKMFKIIKVQSKFTFQDILISFFQSSLFGTPEAFFNSEKKLLAIKVEPYNTGKESNLQKSAIHELTHAITSLHSVVGVAVAEGIAIYIEELYCMANDIPLEDGTNKDEGYIFGRKLVDHILRNVYNNNLDLFFNRITRGNEESFIDDINRYLKYKNIPYNAKELLRLSSILFYAKNTPKSPFEEYLKNDEMEMLRNEILWITNNENIADNLIIYKYLGTIKYITYLCNVLRGKLSNYETVCTTLDREFGLAIEQNGSSILLDNEMVVKIIKKVFQITGINYSDFKIEFGDTDALEPRKL